jgi:hypothetical protein
MKIGIIDADLISVPKKPRSFPNLACMKLSAYHKENGDDVKLLLNYNTLDDYDKIFISKVFTDSVIPKKDNIFFNVPQITERKNVCYGGTGFFLDKATPLPYEIEHHMPDYNLYDTWVNNELERGINKTKFKYYTDFSIGFMTRGCFRKCEYCVNKNSNKVTFNAHVTEFLDITKKGISLWDDNILGYNKWEEVFNELIDTNKKFEFKQGMDIRLLTPDKAKLISSCNYNGHYIFAFDNIKDKETIEKKLLLWKQYVNPKKETKLFILCGFDRNNKYDESFWKQDIIDTFERIRILMLYGCIPFIMRYNLCQGPYKKLYQTINDWCNSVPNYIKKSFRELCLNPRKSNVGESPYMKNLKEIEKQHPDIAKKYFDLKMSDIILDKSWRG